MIDCSILIITRPFWPEGLRECLQSIKDNTTDVSNIEILIKIDHDAAIGFKEIIKEFSTSLPIKVFILDGIFRRNSLPDYSNVLAWNSTGALLWWWSDEVRIITKDWNKILVTYARKYENKIWALYDKNRCGFYPIVTRKYIEVLGRFTYHICIDSFVDFITGPIRGRSINNKLNVANEIDAMERVPIELSEVNIATRTDFSDLQTSAIETSCSDLLRYHDVQEADMNTAHFQELIAKIRAATLAN